MRALTRTIAAAVCLTLLPASTALAQSKKASDSELDSDDIAFAVGETKTISARDVKNYSEGVAGIIDVKLTSDASQFVLVGRRPGRPRSCSSGRTAVSVRSASMSFRAHPADSRKGAQSASVGLNVKTRRIGAQIVVDGVVQSEAELKRVAQITSLYPGQVMSLVQMGSRDQPTPTVTGEVPQRLLIRIDFYFVQYDKNSSYGVGIGWPESIGGGASVELTRDLLAGTTRTATASVSGQPLPRLDIASRRGWAKVAEAGHGHHQQRRSSRVLQRGEQNFPVNTGSPSASRRSNSAWHHGVPSYDPTTRELSLKLGADISDLTRHLGHALRGAPLEAGVVRDASWDNRWCFLASAPNRSLTR